MPQRGITRGQDGAVVRIFSKPNTAYLVEFCNDAGETIDTVTLQEDEIQLMIKFMPPD